MFLEFYGMREQPFGVTPNPRFMYASPSHREALASLLYGVQSDLGFSALIADPGMGKTTLLFDLLERYRDTANTAFLFNTQCNSIDLLRHLLAELGVECDVRDHFSMHEGFKEVLLQSARDGKKVLLILDEAHNLEVSVLETIRLLSNFETSDSKLMHIILSGQAQLASKLMDPGMSQLYQRISIVNRLKPFNAEETFAYIDHRLEVAGYNRGSSLFSSEALDKIAHSSAGVPRTINRLCLGSLSIGCALNQHQIQESVVDEVIADLNLSTLVRVPDECRKNSTHIRARSHSFTPAPQQDAPPKVSNQDATPARVENPSTIPDATTEPDPALEKIRNVVTPQQRALGKAALRATTKSAVTLPSRQSVTTVLMVVVCILLIAWLVFRGFPGVSSIFANTPEQKVADTSAAPSTTAQDTASGNSPPEGHAQHQSSVSNVSKRTSKPVLEILGTSAPIANSLAKRGGTGPSITLPSFGEPLKANPPQRIPSTAQSTTPAEEPNPPNVAIASDEGPQPLANVMGNVLSDAPKVKVETPPPPPKAEIIPGRLIQNPKPNYPEAAKRLGIQGPVVLTAVITKEGKVTQIQRVSGDPRLASAAEDAVRRWKYEPYTLNGEPIEANTSITIDFNLGPK